MSRPTHFEIPSDNPEKSMKFYSDVFGWEFMSWGEGDQPYWLIKTGDPEKPGIDGGLMQKRDPAQPVVNSIMVENVDETETLIRKAGGEVVVPKMAIPTVGWLIYFKDPDGNIFGAMHNDPEAR